MASPMPAPVSAYFAAANAHDADRIAACFAENAVVHDERGDIVGREAIRAWADATGRKYRHTAEIVSVEESGGGTIVTARIEGDFPGSPIHLRFSFNLANGAIGGLEIG